MPTALPWPRARDPGTPLPHPSDSARVALPCEVAHRTASFWVKRGAPTSSPPGWLGVEVTRL